jgi:ankyrin repeat protein
MSPFICVERGDLRQLQAVLNSVDINIRDNVGESLLHSAAGKHGSVEMADELIRRGIDVNLQDECGSTALLFAAVWKRRDIARVILYAGGRVDIADEHGNEPLWYATSNRDYELVKMLIGNGADPHHCNRYGKSPIDIAMEDGGDAVMLGILNRDEGHGHLRAASTA